MAFENRLYELLEEHEDPFDMATVAEVAGNLLGEVAVGVSRMNGVGQATDVLEVTREDEGVGIKAKLHLPHEGWSDGVRMATFSLLHEGFDYIAHENAFVFETSIP
jgi:hypothetical protein